MLDTKQVRQAMRAYEYAVEQLDSAPGFDVQLFRKHLEATLKPQTYQQVLAELQDLNQQKLAEAEAQLRKACKELANG